MSDSPRLRMLGSVLVSGALAWSGCGGPTAPSPAPPSPAAPSGTASFTLSGGVYTLDATGRHPVAGALVEITDESAAWGTYGRPTTDSFGRYIQASLVPRHYRVRASKAGYHESSVVVLAYLERSTTLDFELTSSTAPSVSLTLGSIAPQTGSTGGETAVVITGTGFRPGATVTLGGQARSVYVQSTTTIYAMTSAHSAGRVDVVVANPNGEIVKLDGAYTYAAPDSFDFNGTWVGYALAHPELGQVGSLHADMDLRLTIENNTLTSLMCGEPTTIRFSPPSQVSDGAFSHEGPGIRISGRIVAADRAVGEINTGPCPATRWSAWRQ